jgi:hypothetical protein
MILTKHIGFASNLDRMSRIVLVTGMLAVDIAADSTDERFDSP